MIEHISLPANPVIYEINTWVWLNDLSRHQNVAVTLSDVSAATWDAIAALGVDAVWLMGVWQRSPAGVGIALHTEELLADFMRVLSDFSTGDVVGSPYCIRGYQVDDALGGREGLAAARAQLAQRGIALLLDFVPNHVAPDHPWTQSHPEYFIQGTALDLVCSPVEYLGVGENVFARGSDPYFAPWQDVVQLNAFAPGLRQIMIATLLDIAGQCDGVRCDMAMLMNTEIFTQTWGERAGTPPEPEYWVEVMGAVKQMHPTFLWMAEVYWEMEWRMQQLGFDYCYDKMLYDRLVIEALGAPGTVELVAAHLHADEAYQRKLVRFVENHDEARAARAFPPERLRAATLVCATHLGARLYHEGQFEGRRTKVSVFLGRRPVESVDAALQAWFRQLLKGLRSPLLQDGVWRLCSVTQVTATSDASAAANALAWCWHDPATPDALAVVAVNLSDRPTKVRITASLPLPANAHHALRLINCFDASDVIDLTLDEVTRGGVTLNLAAWAACFWQTPIQK